VSREEPDDDISLIGKRAYVEGGPPANTIETYSKDEIEVDTGVNVVQSTVTPLGDGSFVKETVEVESWPELKGSEWDYLLNTQVVSTQQMVVPPTTFNEPNTSYRAVNEDRSLKIVEEAPIAALNSYLISLPTRTDIQMPTVLKSITTYWTYDSSGSDGDASSSGTMPATGGGTLECMASSSGQFREAAIPTIATEIESIFGSDIPATIYFFYYNSGNGSMSETDLRNRLSSLIGQQINVWPTFKPQAHTIVATGGSVTASAKAVASETILQSIDGVRGNAQGVQTDSSFSRDVNKDIVNLAPTIHRALTVINADQYRSVGARASARARLDGDFNADARSNESTGSLTVSVLPPSFPATTPSDIPRSGLYIVDSKAEPFKWGWVKCSATVVNAGLFAS
jgi:hypothetical protein